MEKLYEEQPYIKEFDAKVLTCQPGKNDLYLIALDRTGFYPEGGGQPFDTGLLRQNRDKGEAGQGPESPLREGHGPEPSLADVRVVEVHEKDGQILHYTDGELAPGTWVHGVIDWERRRRHMEHHTGEHIYSGLVHRYFGYDNVGFHMGQDMVTIDFNGILTMEQAMELEEEANSLVRANIPVEAWYPSSEELHNLDYRSKKELTGPVRIVRISGGDICACCGTHVKYTGEVGIIKITGLKKYKRGVRLDMLCGDRALRDYQKKQDQVMRISNLLSAKQGETAEAVEKLKAESAALKQQIGQLYQQIFTLRCSKLPEREGPLLVFEEELPPAQLRQFCILLCQEKKGSPVLACSGRDTEYYYVLGSRGESVELYTKKLNGLLHGKGSGKGPMAQGMIAADREEIEKVWHEELWR